MKTIGEVLKKARDDLDLSQEEVAAGVRKLTGDSFSRAALAQIESGSTKNPKPHNLQAACDGLGIDFRSALVGVMQSADSQHRPTTQNIHPISNATWGSEFDLWDKDTPLRDDEVALPFFREVELSAGSGSSMIEENHGCKLRFARSTLKRQGVMPDNAYCVTVKGNSMEPVLPDGCTVGIDTSKVQVTNGDWYAIDHHGELRIKIMYKLPGGGYRLRSFNSDEWPDESPVAEADLKILGRVFWWSGLR